MAFTFNPTVWAKLILEKLLAKLVYGVLTNQNWEGEIKGQGDTVKIFYPGDVAVVDYVKNTDMADPEILDHGTEELAITLAKAFHFYIDRLDSLNDPNKVLDSYMDQAFYALKSAIDTFIGSQYVNVAAVNRIIPTVPITKDNVFEFFTQVAKLMDDQELPETGRRAVISSKLKEIIKLSLSDKDTPLGDKATENGYVGQYCGFDLHMTTKVPVVMEDPDEDLEDEEVHKIMFGTDIGITLAQAIPPDTFTMYEPHKRFGKAFKGLTVFGAEMLYSGEKNFLLDAYYS